MGFLQNKRALIVGVASNRSIASGVAKAMHREGAELAFTYQNDKLLTRVQELAAECGSDIVLPLDVEHAVGGQNAVLAGAADPVIRDDLVRRHIHELHARAAMEDVLRGGFVAVTPAVMNIWWRWNLVDHLARPQIAAVLEVSLQHGGRRCVPDGVVDDEHIDSGEAREQPRVGSIRVGDEVAGI